MQKQKRILRGSNGRWTKTEHDRFMKGLQRYGRDWVSVQKVVKTRTLTQVRSHAQKVFLKMSDKDIECLIANENQYEVPPTIEESDVRETEKHESMSEQEQLSKPSVKSEGNLLDLFMRAIQQQQRQSGQHEEKENKIGQPNDEKNTKMPTIRINKIQETQRSGDHKSQKYNQDTVQPITTFIIGPETNSYGVFPIEVDLSQQNKKN